MPTFLIPDDPITSLDAYLASDIGGLGIDRAQRLGPAATIDMVLVSGLRGRGGGGFATGKKWAGIASQTDTRRYVVCNGAEGEPGTFKDRALMRANPYQFVEGMIIAAFAVGADEAFICLKRSFERELEAVTRAVQEFQAAGICTDCKVTIVAGPEEYLFGEEKAMLEVIEGKPPLPRWFPPYEHGLFATAPQLGWEAGTPRLGRSGARAEPDAGQQRRDAGERAPHPGSRSRVVPHRWAPPSRPALIVTTVVGDVIAPDVGEVELGTPLRTVIDAVGSGVAQGRTSKRCSPALPIRSSPADSSTCRSATRLPGDRQRHGRRRVHRLRRHDMHGRRRVPVVAVPVHRVVRTVPALQDRFWRDHPAARATGDRRRKRGQPALDRALVGTGHRRQPMLPRGRGTSDGQQRDAGVPRRVHRTRSTLGRCPRPRRLPIPKLLDLADGVATYDETFWRKRPDWTYDPA